MFAANQIRHIFVPPVIIMVAQSANQIKGNPSIAYPELSCVSTVTRPGLPSPVIMGQLPTPETEKKRRKLTMWRLI
jgi:hypothetical protein